MSTRSGLGGLKTYIEREMGKAQKVIDDFTKEVNDTSTLGGHNILWALRYPDSIIGAAVSKRRYAQLQTMIANFEKAVAGTDEEHTKGVTENIGELTEEAFIAYVDQSFTNELIRMGRCGRGIGQSDIEAQQEIKFLAHFLDDKVFRWF